MSMMKEFESIPKEKFQLVQSDAFLHDKKLETKARSFFADAMIRFKKNKSSVVAFWILVVLVLYALIVPLASPYNIRDTKQNDENYRSMPAYVPEVANLSWGIMDGGRIYENQNTDALSVWRGIKEETGCDPVIREVSKTEYTVKQRGKMVTNVSYVLELNEYFAKGMRYKTFSKEEFEKLQAWQNETGIQVIFPYVDPEDINGVTNSPNTWYKVNKKGAAILDDNGNLQPNYSTREDRVGMPYNSLRLANDPGNWVYSTAKSGAVQCRVFYYNYYQYLYGHEPSYPMGTTAMGADLMTGIGVGARFSLLFAVIVSAINLTIGAVYGAIQGYYGGAIDMVLDRISDILNGVPFVVVTTLFSLHFAAKVGVLGSFLLVYVATGWIGMSALTRKQFYRFKGQEFVTAARTLGAGDWRLMFKHIFPNAIGTIITSCALTIPGVINSETNMTYLGIIDLSSFAGTTIGTLLSQGNATFTSAPNTMLWPSLFIALLMISFNLFGNGLRDAFNPSTRGVDD